MEGSNMTTIDLKLESGKWLAANCGSMPSDSNCQVVMMAPESQKDDLIVAGVRHMVEKHGHEDNDQLASSMEEMLETVEV
jgi:hypothetical protein